MKVHYACDESHIQKRKAKDRQNKDQNQESLVRNHWLCRLSRIRRKRKLIKRQEREDYLLKRADFSDR